MSKLKLTEEIKSFARAEGADLVGIASVGRYAGAPPKVRPQAHLPGAKAVVVLAIHHVDATINFGAEPNSNYPGSFQLGMIPKLDMMAYRVARLIESLGYEAVPIACTTFWHHRAAAGVPFDHAASFSHINAMVAAGLGEYGWHGMAMSPQYGPRQRIISVITTAPLLADPLYMGEPLCDRCRLCEKACWGDNYQPEKLLDSGTIRFMIEDKKIEYAHINRWRCFWGEQCHLDMNHLAERDQMGENEIYAALDDKVDRIVKGHAGYMCSSLKYCMAKPIRHWDKSVADNPLRRKTSPTLSWAELKPLIVKLALQNAVARISIRPLAEFAHLKNSFPEGFRSDALFQSFSWVITVGRQQPGLVEQNTSNQLLQKNLPRLGVAFGRLLMATLDIARMLDDNGYEAMQCHFAESAARLAGWDTVEEVNYAAHSLVTNAPLQALSETLPRSYDGLGTLEELLHLKNPVLKQVQTIGSTSLNRLTESARAELLTVMPGAKSLLVLGAELPRRVVELAGRQEAECPVSYLMVNMQAIKETFWAAHDLADALRQRHYQAETLMEIESNSRPRPYPQIGILPDLRAQAPFAAAAGLGFLGKSGFLIAPKYGPRLRFAFVLTTAEFADSPLLNGKCPDGCDKCARACPACALDSNQLNKNVFQRNDDRCEWARVLGLTAGAGSALTGWRLPDLPVPEQLDEATRKAALQAKDPIQVRCYNSPNHADTQVERCLQACPFV